MSTGYLCSKVTIITERKLVGLGLNEYVEFMKWFDEHDDYCISEFANAASYDNLDVWVKEDEQQEAVHLYKALKEAFKEATGLTLFIGYHSSDDNGDIYDDVDGLYWALGNVYRLTEEAEKVEDLFEDAFFVTYG